MSAGASNALPSTQNHGHTHEVTSSDYAVATPLLSRSVKRVTQSGAVIGALAGAKTGAQPARVSLGSRKGSGTAKHSGAKSAKNRKASAEECYEVESPCGGKNGDDDYYDDMATGFLQFW